MPKLEKVTFLIRTILASADDDIKIKAIKALEEIGALEHEYIDRAPGDVAHYLSFIKEQLEVTRGFVATSRKRQKPEPPKERYDIYTPDDKRRFQKNIGRMWFLVAIFGAIMSLTALIFSLTRNDSTNNITQDQTFQEAPADTSDGRSL